MGVTWIPALGPYFRKVTVIWCWDLGFIIVHLSVGGFFINTEFILINFTSNLIFFFITKKLRGTTPPT